VGLENLLAAIQATRVGPELDRIYAAAIGTLFEQGCPDAEMIRIDEAVEARRREHKAHREGGTGKPATRISYYPAKSRRQVSPDRRKSWMRRREKAALSFMPARLASNFTTGEQATLQVVVEEVREHGCCDRSIPEIAARAGVGQTTARNAIREARRLGLVAVAERRRWRAPNLPNLISIISADWKAWIANNRKLRAAIDQGGGFKVLKATKAFHDLDIAGPHFRGVLRRFAAPDVAPEGSNAPLSVRNSG
jgi:hypothetical protein